MEDQLAKFEPLRLKLANFFCEPERTFSLEECFKIIASFIERFEKAVQENKQWSSLDNTNVKTTETDPKTTLNPTKINRSTSPNPSIISDNNNLFLSNFVNNTSLGVPSGVESLRRRRNSAFPTFELKIKENEEKKGSDDCNMKISGDNSNPPPSDHSQKQQNQEESSNNDKANISTTPQPSSTQPQQTNPPVDEEKTTKKIFLHLPQH
uniref:FH2 domain-containing protein n=1 Tax=Meloidogyne incognita TaxID=6306 RepID=A0A914NUG2_MELIC